MALLGWSFLRERLRGYQVFGIFLAAVGVLLVVSEGDWASLGVGEFGTPGDILILISAVNWAVFSALSRRGLARNPASWMLFYVMGFGWLFTSLLLFTGPGLSETNQLSLSGWSSIIFLGVACSGLAYIFWYDGLKAIPASQVGSFLYLEPLVAVVVAALLLDEPIFWVSLVGGGTILLGVWLVNRRTRRRTG
jgi:drug/metabolite transporter (DMT)-like permease